MTRQSTILRNFDEMSNDGIVIIHLLLIFKFHVFKASEKKTLDLESLLTGIKKCKIVEKKKKKETIPSDNEKRTLLYTNKWYKTNSKLPVHKIIDRVPKNV